MARMVKTEEEKAGQKIASIISDVRLDAELVGTYLGASEHADILNRLVVMVDGIVESRQKLRERLGYSDDVTTNDTVSQNVNTDDVKISVLAELYSTYKDDEDFSELFEYADIAFPAAYLIDLGVVQSAEGLTQYIDEAWGMLLHRQQVSGEVSSLEDLGL